jgi:hypothetical protein
MDSKNSILKSYDVLSCDDALSCDDKLNNNVSDNLDNIESEVKLNFQVFNYLDNFTIAYMVDKDQYTVSEICPDNPDNRFIILPDECKIVSNDKVNVFVYDDKFILLHFRDREVFAVLNKRTADTYVYKFVVGSRVGYISSYFTDAQMHETIVEDLKGVAYDRGSKDIPIEYYLYYVFKDEKK